MKTTARMIIITGLIAIRIGTPILQAENQVHVVENVTGPGTRRMDVFASSDADGSAPLVVLLHGGGDKGNGDMHEFAAELARRGTVVAVPTYYSGQPRTRELVLDTFEDVVCAIRYARDRAAEWGADPDNLTLVGFSYGGYPATAIGLAPEGSYDFDCLPDTSHVPQAVVGMGGAYTYDTKMSTLGWTDTYGQYTGSGNLVNNREVPITLVHGARDANVPVDYAESYFRQLDGAGRAVALEVIDTRHAELIDPADPAGQAAIAAVLDATAGVTRTGRSGPPTTSVYAQLMNQSRVTDR